jgi:hypothetical protein
VQSRARSFDLDGDAVVVSGSARVSRGDGSFAETNVRWTIRCRDGLVYSVTSAPRAGS